MDLNKTVVIFNRGWRQGVSRRPQLQQAGPSTGEDAVRPGQERETVHRLVSYRILHGGHRRPASPPPPFLSDAKVATSYKGTSPPGEAGCPPSPLLMLLQGKGEGQHGILNDTRNSGSRPATARPLVQG